MTPGGTVTVLYNSQPGPNAGNSYPSANELFQAVGEIFMEPLLFVEPLLWMA
jgi:hypothetical protein